jgi:hypothetical protein
VLFGVPGSFVYVVEGGALSPGLRHRVAGVWKSIICTFRNRRKTNDTFYRKCSSSFRNACFNVGRPENSGREPDTSTSRDSSVGDSRWEPDTSTSRDGSVGDSRWEPDTSTSRDGSVGDSRWEPDTSTSRDSSVGDSRWEPNTSTSSEIENHVTDRIKRLAHLYP